MAWHQDDERGELDIDILPRFFRGEESKRFFFEKKKQKTFDFKGLGGVCANPIGAFMADR
jgi:hypothetical protein